MTKFKLFQITPLINLCIGSTLHGFHVYVLRSLRCVTCCNNPSLPKTLSKIHRKRRIGACDLLHPILYLLEKISILYSSSGVLLYFFFPFFFSYRYSKYPIKQEGKQAAENNFSAHKVLKLCTVSFFFCFYIFHFHYKKQYPSPPFLTLYSTNIELNVVAARQS